MEGVEIKKGIYWVGALDYNLRDFHGYVTPRGTTYNSYLVVDEKMALIDTVKSGFSGELLSRVEGVVDPAELDYLVVNHVEMDHSGSATAVMERAGNAEILCTGKGKEFLQAHYRGASKWKMRAVGAGDTLSLGKRTLSFIPAPMLHWPDTMFTYCPEDKILFSNDGFGQHIATARRFYDENRDQDIFGEAQKYYANILMPFSSMVKKKLAELEPLDIMMICPSHGVIFRDKEGIEGMVSRYATWSSGEAGEKAVVAYDTMYGSTESMARSIVDGLNSAGVETRFYNLRVSDWSDIVSEILVSKAVVVGSSTLNNGPLPTVGGFLTYLKGFKPRGKIGFAFGSYGWGGGAVKTITEDLQKSGIELFGDGLQTLFVPGEDVLKRGYELGRSLGTAIKGG